MTANTVSETIAIPKETVEKLVLELYSWARFEDRRENTNTSWGSEHFHALAHELETGAGIERWTEQEPTDEEWEAWRGPIEARAVELYDEWLGSLAQRPLHPY